MRLPLRVLILGSLLCSGCEKPLAITAPPADEEPELEPDSVAGSLRGYGFSAIAGIGGLTLLATGSDSTTCATSISGSATYGLALREGLNRRVSETLASGGRAYVRPVTQHTFSGNGTLGYAEEIRLLAGSSQLGAFQNQAETVDPTAAIVVDVRPEFPITAEQLTGADTLKVVMEAQARATLGNHCGVGTLGQVRWRAYGVVLWLEG